MRIPQSSIIIVAFVAIAGQVSARCFCSSLSENCFSCKELVPRPQERITPKEGISKVFKSIGNTCSCGSTIVRPATPPKPLCNSISLDQPQLHNCNEKTIRAPDAIQGAEVQPNLVYGRKLEDKTTVADAVSLSLAYQLARSLRQRVPEGKIQYGFQVEPLNILKSIPRKNIAEEGLWTVNRAVVELKSADISNTSESDDEEEMDKKSLQTPGYLTYRDIGYCPEKHSTKRFNVKIPSLSIDQLCVNNAQSISDKRCGFKPGQVIQAENFNLGSNVNRGIEDCEEKF